MGRTEAIPAMTRTRTAALFVAAAPVPVASWAGLEAAGLLTQLPGSLYQAVEIGTPALGILLATAGIVTAALAFQGSFRMAPALIIGIGIIEAPIGLALIYLVLYAAGVSSPR